MDFLNAGAMASSASMKGGSIRRAILQTLTRFCWHSRLLYGLHQVARVSQVRRRRDGGLAFPYVVRRRLPNFQILMYHRLTAKYDPFFPGVSVDTFARQVHFLAKHYRVVDLAELLQHLDNGHPIPKDAVVLTFDDGYRDNYELAFPILQQYRVSATIFLTTSFLNQEDVLWNDKISLALKYTPCQEFSISYDGSERCYRLHTPAQRLGAMREMLWLLRRVPHTQRLTLIDEVLQQLGVDDFRELWASMLTWDQVRQMHQQGIGFGAHTVTHPILSRISVTQAQQEILQSKQTIEKELNVPVKLFAYPDGGLPTFNATVKAIVQEAGFHAAVTTVFGTNDATTDRYALRRDGLGALEPATFARTLCWHKFAT